MKRFARFGFISVILGLLVVGCAHTQMTKQSVIEIANRTAQTRLHFLAADYKAPKVSYHKGMWTVTYYPKSAWQDQIRLPGGTPHFSIIVDDSTGTVH
jgi:hypothetical protein